MSWFERIRKGDPSEPPKQPSDPLSEEEQDTGPQAQLTDSAVALADAENGVKPGKKLNEP